MVEECFVCEAPGNRKRLLEAVSIKGKGIVKICENCSEREGIPIVRRPTTFQLKESEKKERIYKRPKKDRVYRRKSEVFEFQENKKSEVGLKDIVDRDYKNKKSVREKGQSPDLVDNFHWVIMRARRAKGVSQERMAKEISESVSAIKMAERGVLPEDGHFLVKKIESFLGIKLVSGESEKLRGRIEPGQPARVIKFDPVTMKNLTIEDLKKLKKMKEGSENVGADLDGE